MLFRSPLSLNLCSTVEIRWTAEWVSALKCGRWPMNSWICDSNISSEDSSTTELCLEGRISKAFFLISIYFWSFTSVRVRAGQWCVFNLLIYFPSFGFFTSPPVSPNHHRMMTKYKNSRILKYFKILISFPRTFRGQT